MSEVVGAKNVCQGVLRLQLDNPREQSVCLEQPRQHVIAIVRILIKLASLLDENVGLRVAQTGRGHRGDGIFVEINAERGRNLLGYISLDTKRVFRLAVIVLGPQMEAVCGTNELCSDAEPVTTASYRSFDHMGDAQLRGNLGDRNVLALEMKCRGSCCDE